METINDRVTQVWLGEYVSLLNFKPGDLRQRIMRWLAEPFVRRFVDDALAFDNVVGAHGWNAASKGWISRYVSGLDVIGEEHVPAEGPLLVVANHPGMTDFMAVCAAIPRNDVMIVAADQPMLRSLPHVAERIIFVSKEMNNRMLTMRQMMRHLRANKTLLIFPAGRGEPDPAVMPGAEESLLGWSESVALAASRSPQARVLPALVSGVLWKQALDWPVARQRKTLREVVRAAGALQLLWQIGLGQRVVRTRVLFGKPIPGAELACLDSLEAMMLRIRQSMAELLATLRRPPLTLSRKAG